MLLGQRPTEQGFGEQLTYDNPILLPNFINFESPPCSPDIPIFSSFLVAWPCSLVNFIISLTPSSPIVANGLFFIISCSRYCGRKLLASSRLIPSVVSQDRLFRSWNIRHILRNHQPLDKNEGFLSLSQLCNLGLHLYFFQQLMPSLGTEESISIFLRGHLLLLLHVVKFMQRKVEQTDSHWISSHFSK